RLSMASTVWPLSSRNSQRCDPMKPAPPVTSVLGIQEAFVDRSVGVGLTKPPERGEEEDLDVEKERPILDVVEIEFDPLLQARIAAPAVDLRPAGEAAAHAVAQHVVGDVVLEFVHELGPFRPGAD